MGKASRIRNAKAAVAEIKKEQLARQQKEAARKKKVNIITAVVSVLLAIVFVGGEGDSECGDSCETICGG